MPRRTLLIVVLAILALSGGVLGLLNSRRTPHADTATGCYSSSRTASTAEPSNPLVVSPATVSPGSSVTATITASTASKTTGYVTLTLGPWTTSFITLDEDKVSSPPSQVSGYPVNNTAYWSGVSAGDTLTAQYTVDPDYSKTLPDELYNLQVNSGWNYPVQVVESRTPTITFTPPDPMFISGSGDVMSFTPYADLWAAWTAAITSPTTGVSFNTSYWEQENITKSLTASGTFTPGPVSARVTAQRSCTSAQATADATVLAYKLKLFTDDPIVGSNSDGTGNELAIGIDGYDQVTSDTDRSTARTYFSEKLWTLQLVGRNADTEDYAPIGGVEFSNDGSSWTAPTTTADDSVGELAIRPDQWTNDAASQTIHVRATDGISYDDVLLRLTIKGTTAKDEFTVYPVGLNAYFRGVQNDDQSITSPDELETFPTESVDTTVSTSAVLPTPATTSFRSQVDRLVRDITSPLMPVANAGANACDKAILNESKARAKEHDEAIDVFSDTTTLHWLRYTRSPKDTKKTYRLMLRLSSPTFYEVTGQTGCVETTGGALRGFDPTTSAAENAGTITWSFTMEEGETTTRFPITLKFPSSLMSKSSTDGSTTIYATLEAEASDGTSTTIWNDYPQDFQMVPLGTPTIAVESIEGTDGTRLDENSKTKPDTTHLFPGDTINYSLNYTHPASAPTIPSSVDVTTYLRLSSYALPVASLGTTDTPGGIVTLTSSDGVTTALSTTIDDDRHAYKFSFPFSKVSAGQSYTFSYSQAVKSSIDTDVTNIGTQTIFMDTAGPQKASTEIKKDDLWFEIAGKTTLFDQVVIFGGGTNLPHVKLQFYADSDTTKELASDRTNSLYSDDNGQYSAIYVKRSAASAKKFYPLVTLQSDSDHTLAALTKVGGSHALTSFSYSSVDVPEAASVDPKLDISPDAELSDPPQNDGSAASLAKYFAAFAYRQTQRFLSFLKSSYGYDLTEKPLSITIADSGWSYYVPSSSSALNGSIYLSPGQWGKWITVQGGSYSLDPNCRSATLFHELGHHVLSTQGFSYTSNGINKNHNGFVNDASSDSVSEGFAQYMSLLAEAQVGVEYSVEQNSAKQGRLCALYGGSLTTNALTTYWDFNNPTEVWSRILRTLARPSENRVGKDDEEAESFAGFLWNVTSGHVVTTWTQKMLRWVNLPAVNGVSTTLTTSTSLPSRTVLNTLLSSPIPTTIGAELKKLGLTSLKTGGSSLNSLQQTAVLFGLFRDSNKNFQFDSGETQFDGPSNSTSFIGNVGSGEYGTDQYTWTLKTIGARTGRQ